MLLALRYPLKYGIFAVLSLSMISCSGRRPAEQEVLSPSPTVEDTLASVTVPEIVTPSFSGANKVIPPDSRAASEPVSSFDILHTQLSLGFNFSTQQVIGTAIHRLNPSVESLDHLRFDAKDMEIRSVSVRWPNTNFVTVSYQYNNQDLDIPLETPVGKTVALEVRIDYVANPTRNGRKLGLHFVDPLDEDPGVPTQIWTLGQPEDNQYWFPAWDFPNDRMTFDLSLTVPEKYSTIANGDLVEQIPMPDGLRKDRWVLNKPHPAYLTGFVVGEYAAVVENYVRSDGSTVPLAYLVEPGYQQYVRQIFGETPAMMRFFENKLGFAYPWSNYKQVTAREFTASGMENTTATILYDQIQHDQRAHLDFTGRDLIAHELAHQWFGNLLTSRNWGNLPLNEGFASYFERLYLEEAHGQGAAQAHTINDRNTYLAQAEALRRPIIWHGFSDPNEMYDAHTYQKAALVLHQLRLELGDDVWWQGIRQYVRENAFRNVVIEDLQRAMEQAAGRSLSGFFYQWYRRPGHPKLLVEHQNAEQRGLYEVRVRQEQDSIRIGNFSFGVDIEVNVLGSDPWTQRYRVASRDTTFRFAIPGNVAFIRFDAGDWVLGDITVTKNLQEWFSQARYDDEIAGRYDALQGLGQHEPENAIRDVLVSVLQSDENPFVRKEAAVQLGKVYSDQQDVRVFLGNAVRNDQDAGVRRESLVALGQAQDEMLLGALRAAVEDPSYLVVAKAIELYAGYFGIQAIPVFRSLYDVKSWNNTIELALIDAYGRLRAIEGIPYLQDHLADSPEQQLKINSLASLARIAQYHPDVRNNVSQSILSALDNNNEPVRYAAIQALAPLKDANISSEISRRMPTEPSLRIREAMARIVSQTP